MADDQELSPYSWVPNKLKVMPMAGATVPFVMPGVGGFNPNTGAPMEPTPEQEWEMRGGSPATMHRAQTRLGYRPPIDARGANRNDGIRSADRDANDIRSNWVNSRGESWGGNPGMGNVGGTGGDLWSQMHQHFTEANAQRAAEVQSARQAVIDRLKPMKTITDNPPDKTPALSVDTPYGRVARTTNAPLPPMPEPISEATSTQTTAAATA